MSDAQIPQPVYPPVPPLPPLDERSRTPAGASHQQQPAPPAPQPPSAYATHPGWGSAPAYPAQSARAPGNSAPPVPPYAAQTVPLAGYASPAGHPPAGYAPPANYAPYAAPYAPPAYGAPPVAARREKGPSTLGLFALFLALAAAVVAPIVGAIAGFNVALGAGREIALRPLEGDFDWSILAPVREWVLMGEVSFWAGTVVGIWAIVQGIIAIVRSRGRVPGIVALIVAALGPIVFALALQIALAAGFASGASIAG